MKLKDALTPMERSLILASYPTSFMYNLIHSGDIFYNSCSELAKGYYVRSANKTVTRKIEDFIISSDTILLPLRVNDDDAIEFDVLSNLSNFINVDDILEIRIKDSYDGAVATVSIYFYDKEYNIIDSEVDRPQHSITKYWVKSMHSDCQFIRFTIYNPIARVNMSYSMSKDFISFINLTTKYNWSEISNLIRRTFIDKWNSVYKTLTAQYDVTKPINITEEKTGEDTRTINKDSTDTFDFNDRRDIVTHAFLDRKDTDTEFYSDDYEYKIQDNNTRKISEKTSENDYIYGFNSPSKVASNSSEIVGNSADNITQDDGGSATTIKGVKTLERAKTGTETHTNGKLGSETHTIDDDTTDTIEYNTTETKTGSNSPIVDSVIKELDFRDKAIFVNMIYADIDSILTLPIYS